MSVARFSQSFIHTLREDPRVAECRSQRYLLKGCFLTMIASGIYSYLPLGYRVLTNIKAIIRKHMDKAGAQELFMSALQPLELWQTTGRDEDLKDVMFRIQGRQEGKLCLGPTHEEEITEIARRSIFSHKQLPCILYQIQTKFRDEPRPRYGLMRSAEFIMKDAYSFDKDTAGLNKNYQTMLTCYQNIFKECGLDTCMVEADSGAMGGSLSHEFMVPAPIGEDILFRCQKDGAYAREAGACPTCAAALHEERMVELGHIFQLGTKYSLAQEGFFLNEQGTRMPYIMGCYGIGVSRILSAIAEVASDDKGLIWPRSLAPYCVNLVVLGKVAIDEALGLAQKLSDHGISVLVDERVEPAGVKFNDANLLGNPYTVVMGKKYAQSQTLDCEVRKTSESHSFTVDELCNFLTK